MRKRTKRLTGYGKWLDRSNQLFLKGGWTVIIGTLHLLNPGENL